MDVVNVAESLSRIVELWSPKRVAQVNDYDVRLAKVAGEFEWHSHTDTDEFFLVVGGHLTIQLRDRDVQLSVGDMFVVPRGTEHRPRADVETSILMFEPTAERHTGDVVTSRTREIAPLGDR